MTLVWSHVSMTAPYMLLGAAKEATSYQANTFMIYTGAPQNTRRRAIEDLKIPEAHEYMSQNNIGVKDIVIHAPYIVNLGNTFKPDNFEFAIRSEERRVGKEC